MTQQLDTKQLEALKHLGQQMIKYADDVVGPHTPEGERASLHAYMDYLAVECELDKPLTVLEWFEQSFEMIKGKVL